jgi:hypothetical protein
MEGHTAPKLQSVLGTGGLQDVSQFLASQYFTSVSSDSRRVISYSWHKITKRVCEILLITEDTLREFLPQKLASTRLTSKCKAVIYSHKMANSPARNCS